MVRDAVRVVVRVGEFRTRGGWAFMPNASPHLCGKAGCQVLVAHGSSRCPAHAEEARQARRQYEQERGSAASRGYGSRWRRYTAAYKRAHPLCAHCLAAKRVTPTQCVDHIVAAEGPHDPLFWLHSNHQALCNSCHSIKTATKDGGIPRGRGT
jgi:5-methylcytosine-specific restriction protein A